MYQYLSEKVPSDVHFVLNKYGTYRKAKNSKELEGQIKHFVRKFGANGLQSLAEIHPDRELIELTCTTCKAKDSKITELQSSKDLRETILNDRNMYFNATGNGPQEEKIVNKMTINSVVVGGFILMGIALLLKSNK